MKLLLIFAMLLTGCASMQQPGPTRYYPSGYTSSSYRYQPQVRTYWLYNNNRFTPIIQSGPIIMPLTGFGFR